MGDSEIFKERVNDPFVLFVTCDIRHWTYDGQLRCSRDASKAP